ncbi:glutathione transferase, partial [Listeria weihenstephanensis FSL R9-0317]
FYVEKEDMRKSKKWLADRGIEVIAFFWYTGCAPQLHASIYFEDPDRNVLELITAVELDTAESTAEMSFEEWEQAYCEAISSQYARKSRRQFSF